MSQWSTSKPKPSDAQGKSGATFSSSSHSAGGGGGNIVQWLAAKTSNDGAGGGSSNTTTTGGGGNQQGQKKTEAQGALAWLTAQTSGGGGGGATWKSEENQQGGGKGGKGGKQQGGGKKSGGDKPSGKKQGGAAKKESEPVQSPTQANTPMIPAPRSVNTSVAGLPTIPAPASVQQQQQQPAPATGPVVPAPRSYQAAATQQHADPSSGRQMQQQQQGGKGSRRNFQKDRENAQQQKNKTGATPPITPPQAPAAPPQISAEELRRMEAQKAQAEAIEAQQQALEQDPQYAAWIAEQQALAAQGESARQRVFSNLANQESQQALESRAFARQKERLNVAEVTKLIAEHDITIICTDTGSGKSTTIPSVLLETGDHNTRIVSTQPRRTATMALANHVAKTRGEVVGEDIGYWIRGDKRGDDGTRLWYMTSYTLLLHLLKDPLHPPFTHILLDEFHERQPDLEVTTAILRLVLKHRTANFKLVLMSATLNSEDWENYFGEGLSVAVYKQSEPEHPIHDFFMAEVCAMTGVNYNKPSEFFSPVLVDNMIMEHSLFVAQQLITFLNAVSQTHQSILVFLPGRAQVEQFVIWANNTLRNRVDPIAWHSAIDVSQIQAAINRKGNRAQKIYLATDIAEVSITLPDVVYVIDLGLVKRPLITGGQTATVLYPPLLTQWVSKVNIAQRRGRVGRVQQGFYFCLISAETIAQLPDYPASPIQHSRIDELALHSLQVVANPIALFGLCRGQPQIETITTTMRNLTSLGCILKADDKMARIEDIKTDIHNNKAWSDYIMEDASELIGGGAVIDEYRTTFIGRLMQLIPVSTQQGMLVFYGFLTGLESLMILAAAVTNSMSPFDVRVAGNRGGDKGGRRNRERGFESAARAMEQTEATMKEFSHNLSSDVVCVMGAILKCLVQCRGHEHDPTFMRVWCEDRNMSVDKTMAIIELNAHIKYELSGFIPFRDVEDPSVLLTQLEKVAPIVVACTCCAFASQALEVSIEGNMHSKSKETGVGLFTDLKGMPDLHSPSCIRWELGDVIVPVAVNLRFSHMLVGFATAVKTAKEFYLALLLFAYRVKYGAFADDAGTYYEFSVCYSNTNRYVEVDQKTAELILQFRGLCNSLCQTMRLQYSHQNMSQHAFEENVLKPRDLLPMNQQQVQIATVLVNTFFGAPHKDMKVEEVRHGDGEDELDHETLFGFGTGEGVEEEPAAPLVEDEEE